MSSWLVTRGAAIVAIVAALPATACGKKGPPLPPLVKVPVAPAEFVAERRGDEVTIQFTVPASNTDNTRPANIERVDVYAITAPSSIPDDELLKRGTVVGSVAVKAPRDPDAAVDADEPDADAEPPEGAGLDQGIVAHVDDHLTPAAQSAVTLLSPSKKAAAGSDDDRPLIGPGMAVPSRVYASVGISTRGKRGAISRRAVVPLVPPPPPPPAPAIEYDEKSVHVGWDAAAIGGDEVLPSHPLGVSMPTFAYHVYEVKPGGDGGAEPAPVRLTKTPVEQRQYDDARMTWGERRCYAVRTIERLGNLSVESEPSAPACVALADTFPPAPPRGLRAVGTEGAISLIWDPSGEDDLAGYLVLRGSSADALQPITPAPIQDTTFRDTVPAGVPFFYAVAAVDKAGNHSAPSPRVEETARN